jgi:NAD(P)H-flavin reductase
MDLRSGERAEISGPLGNTWASAGAEIPEGDIALIAGGVGIAPLALYAQELESREFDFYAGFKSGSFGLEGVKPRSRFVTSEDGAEGLKGRVLDFFSPQGYSLVCACGPEPMLKAAASICEDSGVPCLISLERHMACGVGACLGCTVTTWHGNRRCCADGPVFNAREVQFGD